LRNTVHPVLGGVALGHRIKRLQTAYEITSIRQLCNMLSPIWKTNYDAEVTTYSGFYWCPGGDLYDPATNQADRNYLWQMMQVFRYYRGGTRVSMMTNNLNTNVYSYATHFNGVGLAIGATTEDLFADSYDLTNLDEGFVYCPNATFNTFDVVLPYLSKYNCRLVQRNAYLGIVDYPENDDDTGFYLAKCSTTPADTNWSVIWMMGAADDFMLGFQTGIPVAIWVSAP